MDFSQIFGLGDSKLRDTLHWDTFAGTMTPIFIENKLLGVKVNQTRISAFVSAYKHYAPPAGFHGHMFQSNFNDQELFEAISFVNQYCQIWKKAIVSTTEPGLFLFDDISRSDQLFQRCLCSTPARRAPRRKGAGTNEPPDEKKLKRDHAIETDFQKLKHNVHHLFNPQILRFDNVSRPNIFRSANSSGSTCCCSVNKKLLEIRYPPSYREDYLRLSINNQSVAAAATLPYKLSEVSVNYSQSNHSLQIKFSKPSNYDEHLRMKSDQLNKLRHRKYIETILAEKEKLKTSKLPLDTKTETFVDVVLEDNGLLEKLVDKDARLFRDETIQKEQNAVKKELSCTSIHTCNNLDCQNCHTARRRTNSKRKRLQLLKNAINECTEISGKCIRSYQLGSPSKLTGCGITLKKEFYYCTPPICSLDLLVDDSGRCIVNELRVGHELFGHVTFHGENNVRGLNLDDIIDFKLKEFSLYPTEKEEVIDGNERRKRALECPATVVLFNVWPMNKSKTKFITDTGEIEDLRYEDLLRRSCSRMKAWFLYYNPSLGHWAFKINC